MELEIIRLSEINQTEKDKYHMFCLICSGVDFDSVGEGRGKERMKVG
jgi:hypothetical protein